MQLEPKQQIELQTCHMTQHTSSSGVKANWTVEKNITNEVIIELPNHLSEKEVFAVINFARKYELEAFNTGIKFQKNIANDYLYSQIKEQKEIVKVLSSENERLATALDNMTKG